MTGRHPTASHPLASTPAYLQREAARRAKGGHTGMIRLADAELGALLELLRRDVGAARSNESTSNTCGINQAEELVP